MHRTFIAARAKIWLSLNKEKLIDGLVLLIVVASALIYVRHFELFSHALAAPTIDQKINLNEALAVLALFCSGLMVFSYRRLLEARRENRRRIVAEREARTLAFNDVLTGLPNRRQFDEALKAATELPPGADDSHTLLLMDLNGFKRVNDIYGHAAGDEVLIHVGARLNRAMRDGDLVARLGGDEFAVLSLQVHGGEAAMSLALRIMQAFEAPITAGGAEHRLGVALGISLMPQDGSEPDELMRKADIALYRAKSEKALAPSAVRFFEVGMDAHIRERDILERELRLAIDRNEIQSFYQPLIDIEHGGVVGFEALARWTSPTLGPVSPSRFIPLAEDTGLIGLLSEKLLEQACSDAAGWPASVHLAFNVSGALLQSGTFAQNAMAIFARTGFEPSRIELEITETALVRDLKGARRVLGPLRSSGVRIALDDFGTGYSSLYHLRALKPDKIKIDRSFVDGMEHDADSATIVKALIGLGLGLGAKVTAEGVETMEQETMLRQQGCDQGQGYRFSAAVDAAEARSLLSTARIGLAATGTP